MPPPKSKKKKSKTSRSTTKEVSTLRPKTSTLRPKTLRDLNEQAEELCTDWEVSPQREVLIEQIRERISSQPTIYINNALCLGLGSLEESKFQHLPGWTRVTRRMKDSASHSENTLQPSEEDMRRFKPVAKGEKRNRSLYQLLVFETVIKCLRMFLLFLSTFYRPMRIIIIYPANTPRQKIPHRPNSLPGSRLY